MCWVCTGATGSIQWGRGEASNCLAVPGELMLYTMHAPGVVTWHLAPSSNHRNDLLFVDMPDQGTSTRHVAQRTECRLMDASARHVAVCSMQLTLLKLC